MASEFSRRSFLQGAIGGGAACALFPKFRAFGAGVTLTDEDIEPEEREAIAGLAEEFRKKYDVPGLSIAIARNGRMQYQQAFGQTEHDGAEPLDISNLFRIASISKPITAVAVFKLIEQERLRLDSPVFGKGALLGTEYGSRPYKADLKAITVDNLLAHTAGGWGKRDDPMFSNVSMSQRELISWVLDNQPLEHPVGSTYDYSNFGYCLLGRVIEKAAAQSYARFVQENVLAPSGIRDMQIARNSRNERFLKEVVYFGQNGEDPYSLNVTRMDSHGGWIATPSDLVRFTLQIAGDGGGPALLKPETVAAMTAQLTVAPGRARGWNISGKGHWWHGGDLAGSSATLVRHAGGLCWAALVNTRTNSTDVRLDNFMWKLIGKVKAWSFAIG